MREQSPPTPRKGSAGFPGAPAAAGAPGAPGAAGDAGASSYTGAAELTDAMREGIEACRRGDWKLGLPVLSRIAEDGDRSRALPALVYSYLGYGVALRQQRVQEGLRLCQHAVKLEFFQAESYLNLARTQLLANNRRSAIRAIQDGLKVEPDNEALLALHHEIGMRRSPVLSFLDRSHPVNLVLGRLRHAFSRHS